jgi:putrescine transport system permease protein
VIITLVAIGTVVASILIARAERERAKAIAQAQRDDG